MRMIRLSWADRRYRAMACASSSGGNGDALLGRTIEVVERLRAICSGSGLAAVTRSRSRSPR